jgi:hypothetical protein
MSIKGPEKAGEILLYQTDDGQTTLSVRLEAETVWLNLNQVADLFQRDKSVISRHMGNIFKTGELERESTVAKFATVQQEGSRKIERMIDYYNNEPVSRRRG